MGARRIVGAAGLLLVALAAVACPNPVTGSGHVVSRDVRVGTFSGLRVSNGFSVRISIGEPAAVTVRTDDNLVDRLDVGVSGGTLRIGLEDGVSVSDATLEADVTAPSLSSIEQSGGTTVRPTGPMGTSPFRLTMSGGSRFEGSIEVRDATIQLSGGSEAEVSGSASTVTATLSGASQLRAYGLGTDRLTIDLSGASHGEVDARTISVSAAGASNLTYRGSPTFVRKETSGASAITQA